MVKAEEAEAVQQALILTQQATDPPTKPQIHIHIGY